MLEAATQAALTEMAAERCLLLANIAILADWEALPGSHKTGAYELSPQPPSPSPTHARAREYVCLWLCVCV
jgi:hypothetical protein